jgi:transcriptional regulator with XRE-family HTH domain
MISGSRVASLRREAFKTMVTDGSGRNGSAQPLPPKAGEAAPAELRPLRWHRIRTVRRQQGMSLRTAARQLGAGVRDVRKQEDEATDLRLSDLFRWQAVLDVPLAELLVEPDTPLSRPVLDRARMVRLMKTAVAILECAATPRERRLAQNLMDQLKEVMPELKDVAAWHSVGQRRSLDDYGRIVDRSISDEFFRDADNDLAD